jgi:hypothetical protein
MKLRWDHPIDGREPVPPLRPGDPAASTGADLLGPGDPARERRLDWAKLLKRVFVLDVLVCARCTGPMRMISFVDDGPTARKILNGSLRI